MTKSIFIISGEASGDLHGASLVEELTKRDPSYSFYAMGGRQIAEAGATLLVDAKELAVVGFIEVLAKLRQIRHAFRVIKQAIRTHRPEAVILIDYPGFNLRLAKSIKQCSPHTKIIYYISPPNLGLAL